MRCLLALLLVLPVASAHARVFTVDPQDERVYVYDDDGALEASFDLAAANEHAQGIAFVEGDLLVLDRRDRRLYRYGDAGNLLAVSSELRQAGGGALSTTIGGVASDGDDLWVVDRGRGKLLRYALDAVFDGDGALLATQEIALARANARAEGVALDDTHLYVLDHIDRRVYRYQQDGGGDVAVSRLLAQADGGGTRAPYGIARTADAVLMVDASRDKVYRYALADLFAGSGPVAAASEFKLVPADDNPRDVVVDAPQETTTTTTTPTTPGGETTSTTEPDGGTTSTTTPDGGTTSTTTPGASTSTTVAGSSTTSTTAPPRVVEVPAFVTVDGQSLQAYRYGDDGGLEGSFALENGHPQGAALSGGDLYVLDGADRRLYHYDGSGGLVAVSRELARASGQSFGTTGGGVAIDGDDVWVLHRGDRRIARYSLDDAFSDGAGRVPAEEEITLDGANVRAEGLALDGGSLYVLDQDRLFRYASGGGPALASAIMTGGTGNLGAAYGLAVSDGAAFVVDAARDAVFGYDLATLFAGGGRVVAGAETPLAADNDDARDLAVAR